MDQISLTLNKDHLLSFFKAFHTLTGIKIALFSESGKEILSYPEAHCPFCGYIRSSEAGNNNCEISNKKSFARCQKTKKIEIFHCHAGLIETTVPLIDTDAVIGYIMFGQITDNPDKTSLRNTLSKSIQKVVHQPGEIDASVFNVVYKNHEQINATAKILEACTLYVLLSNMISLRNESFTENLNLFLLSHLSEDLSVDRLTEEFNISKNKLYDSVSKTMGVGIAKHIKNLRLEEAKRLLVETDMTIVQIAYQVGFTDYNYFCRVFKKEIGIPAGKYRSMNDSGDRRYNRL
ncbi:MAG: PocR ligand-binding domain-containing protein [Lachnospiraceae bacterium]|nr:PocR ligand-binding domain-containing protein [Lachnospiraceae bacterium]